MTENQKKFCDEYLIDCNATRAYKAVYKNVKKDSVASSCSYKLLRNAEVKKYIDEQLAKISSEKIADAEEVMKYLTSVMRGESQAEIVVVEGCGDGVTNAVKVSKNPDEKERLKAAELLGKRFGLFKEKVELEAETKGVVIIDDISKSD